MHQGTYADDCQIKLFQDGQMMLLAKTEEQRNDLVTISDLVTRQFKMLHKKGSMVSLW